MPKTDSLFNWVFLLAFIAGICACDSDPQNAAFQVAAAQPEALRVFMQQHCKGLSASDADRLFVCQSADDRLWDFETGQVATPPTQTMVAALEPR